MKALAYPEPAKDRSEPTDAARLSELAFHASGFVVRTEGKWTAGALAQFQHFLALRHLSASQKELKEAVEAARRDYLRGDHRLYICAAQPCCKTGFDGAIPAKSAGIPISRTGCQGQCKHAPVLSLRVGSQTQMFADITSLADWQTAMAFASRAIAADSLLIDVGDADPFLHDAVHQHPGPDACLRPLRFLLGHFRGEGRFALRDYGFEKEVIGTAEAGGRFIALRMAGSYPLADGRKDVHKALVIVGLDRFSKRISGQAFTDGGTTQAYEVEEHERTLQFEDALPDHGHRWKRARKSIRPTDEGFEERLEVDAGDGFTTYYTIAMRKLAA